MAKIKSEKTRHLCDSCKSMKNGKCKADPERAYWGICGKDGKSIIVRCGTYEEKRYVKSKS